MSATLKPVLESLNLKTREEQVAFVRLLHASGAYGSLPAAPGMLSETQAGAVLDQVQFKDSDAALDWLHQQTQKHFLRPHGVERADTPEPGFAQQYRNELLPLLDTIGITKERPPQRKHYGTLLLLGAMETTVDERLAQMEKLWNDGVRADRIVLLGSERLLQADKEPTAQQGAKTEAEMMLRKVNAHKETWPDSLKQIPITEVSAPMKASGQRADTLDTVKEWMRKEKHVPGTVLAVSDQPHVAYQHAAVEAGLTDGFQLETVGAPANKDTLKIIVALDGIAREINVGLSKLRTRMHQNETRRAHVDQVTMVDPMQLKTDPKRFQFRTKVDASGVEEAGRQQGEYDPLVHGDTLLLWRDKTGQMFVVDGHHRTEFFQRLRRDGKGPAQVPARILDEADGYTADDARIIGAYVNFQKNHVPDLAEAATVFHEVAHGKAHLDLLPALKPQGELATAWQAGQLSERAFAPVKRGEVSVEMAADVAATVKEPDTQVQVISILANHARGSQASLAF